MFKAVKMKRLKFLLLSFVLGCAMLAGAQTPEVFPLWPQGVKENNGIKVDRTVDDQGGISNNSTAELLVFHPDPAKNTGKAVLICPGGGYTYLAMGYEGEEFAQWLVKQGITGIVLKYRMPNQHDRIPMTDALRAMKWIRSRSEEWGIDPAKVGIAGFSAGGHLASTVSTHFDSGKSGTTDRLEQYSSRPDFQILFYGVGQKLLCKWRFLPALVPEIRFQFHFRVNINGTNVIAVINPNHFSVQPIPLHQRTVYIFQQFVLDQMRELRFQCPALFLKNHFVCNRADTVMVHCI